MTPDYSQWQEDQQLGEELSRKIKEKELAEQKDLAQSKIRLNKVKKIVREFTNKYPDFTHVHQDNKQMRIDADRFISEITRLFT